MLWVEQLSKEVLATLAAIQDARFFISHRTIAETVVWYREFANLK
jgi:hypothetical protein